MARSDVQAAVDQLYAAPLEEFVPERTRLAKELRAEGDKTAAAELAKLPKPTAAAWALNHVAREDPDAVAEWLEAAEGLRDASMHASEVGGDALRAAMAAHRDATGRLTAAVRERSRPSGRALSGPMLERVRTLLQAATADPRHAELLRAGRVTEEKTPPPLMLEPAPQRPRKRRAAASPRRAPKRDREAEERAKRRAELEGRAAALEQEIEGLRAEAARRADSASAAAERLEDARRALRRTESEAAAAHDASKDAERAAAAAERELRQLRARLGTG
jgi:uncharacterized small protein (DUF1192 family)